MEKGIQDNYHEGLGIEILTVREGSKKFNEEDDVQIEKIDVAEFGFTEAFDILVQNGDEEKVSKLCFSMQLTAQASLSTFIDDIEYVISKYENKENVLDGKRFCITYWLRDNDTLVAKISDDEINELLEEIDAGEDTKNKVALIVELTENRSQGSCDTFLTKIKKMMHQDC